MTIKIVGEIGINSNGDIELAKKLIDMAKACGFDAVKFQKRDIEEVYTEEELNAPRESPWGITNRGQKAGLEFSIPDYYRIDSYCRSVGIEWFVSAWDLGSLALMNHHFENQYIKIASALLTNHGFLQSAVNMKKDIILSTGMSTAYEIDNAVSILKPRLKYILMTTSSYPTDITDLNLHKINEMKNRYKGVKIGFSNHYPNSDACLWAMSNGAEMIECHITLDKNLYGSDQKASLDEKDMKEVSGFRNFCEGLSDDVDWELKIAEILVKIKLRKGKAR